MRQIARGLHLVLDKQEEEVLCEKVGKCWILFILTIEQYQLRKRPLHLKISLFWKQGTNYFSFNFLVQIAFRKLNSSTGGNSWYTYAGTFNLKKLSEVNAHTYHTTEVFQSFLFDRTNKVNIIRWLIIRKMMLYIFNDWRIATTLKLN